jgi:hypothetical protein
MIMKTSFWMLLAAVVVGNAMAANPAAAPTVVPPAPVVLQPTAPSAIPPSLGSDVVQPETKAGKPKDKKVQSKPAKAKVKPRKK